MNDFEIFCQNNNISVTYLNLPVKIKGFCFFDGNEYNICICNKHTHTQNVITLIHEMIHIFKNHFTCETKYFEFCEKETKNIIENLKLLQNSYLETNFA